MVKLHLPICSDGTGEACAPGKADHYMFPMNWIFTPLLYTYENEYNLLHGSFFVVLSMKLRICILSVWLSCMEIHSCRKELYVCDFPNNSSLCFKACNPCIHRAQGRGQADGYKDLKGWGQNKTLLQTVETWNETLLRSKCAKWWLANVKQGVQTKCIISDHTTVSETLDWCSG